MQDEPADADVQAFLERVRVDSDGPDLRGLAPQVHPIVAADPELAEVLPKIATAKDRTEDLLRLCDAALARVDETRAPALWFRLALERIEVLAELGHFADIAAGAEAVVAKLPADLLPRHRVALGCLLAGLGDRTFAAQAVTLLEAALPAFRDGDPERDRANRALGLLVLQGLVEEDWAGLERARTRLADSTRLAYEDPTSRAAAYFLVHTADKVLADPSAPYAAYRAFTLLEVAAAGVDVGDLDEIVTTMATLAFEQGDDLPVLIDRAEAAAAVAQRLAQAQGVTELALRAMSLRAALLANRDDSDSLELSATLFEEVLPELTGEVQEEGAMAYALVVLEHPLCGGASLVEAARSYLLGTVRAGQAERAQSAWSALLRLLSRTQRDDTGLTGVKVAHRAVTLLEAAFAGDGVESDRVPEVLLAAATLVITAHDELPVLGNRLLAVVQGAQARPGLSHHPGLMMIRGDLEWTNGELAHAEASYRAAVTHQLAGAGRKWPDGYVDLLVGDLLSDRDRPDRAAPHLAEAVRRLRRSRVPELLGPAAFNYGRILLHSGELDGAIAIVTEASVAATEAHDSALLAATELTLGIALSQRSRNRADLTAALQHLTQADEADPGALVGPSLARYLCGHVHLDLGRTDGDHLRAAVPLLREAVAWPAQPWREKALADLAAALLLQPTRTTADLQEAADSATEAARLSADHDPATWAGARLNLAKAISLLGGPHAAEQALSILSETLATVDREQAPVAWQELPLVQVDILLTVPGSRRMPAAHQASAILDQLLTEEADRERRFTFTVALLRTRCALGMAGDSKSASWAMENGPGILADLRARGDQEQWAWVALAVAAVHRAPGDRGPNVERAIGLLNEVNETITAELVPAPHRDRLRALVTGELAEMLRRRTRGDRANNIERGLAALAPFLDGPLRDQDPMAWAVLSQNRGTLLLDRVVGDRRRNVDLAIECFEQALSVTTIETDPENWANIHLNLSHAYLLRETDSPTDNATRSITHAEKALTQLSPELQRSQRVQVLQNLSGAMLRTADSTPQVDQVLARLHEAETLVSREVDPWSGAEVDRALGQAWYKRAMLGHPEDFPTALTAFRAALEVFTPSRAPHQTRDTAEAGAITAYAAHNWSQAGDLYLTALDAEDVIMAAAVTPYGRASELRRVSGLHAGATIALARAGRLREAVLAAERGRARVLSEELGRRVAERRVQAADPEGYAAMADAKRTLATAVTAGSPDQIEAAVQALATAYQAAEYEVDRPVDPTDLRAAVGGNPHTALVYSLCHDDGLHLVVTHAADGLDVEAIWTELSSDELIPLLARPHAPTPEGMIAATYLGADYARRTLTDDLPQIGARLMTPLVNRLTERGLRRVILVPGGPLGLVPLHAAPTDAHGSCLLDIADVAYAPSARALHHLSTAGPASTAGMAPSNPLVVGDPTGDLPYAAREASAVGTTLGAEPLLGHSATRAAVLGRLGTATVVHLACHAVFRGSEPEQSNVQLTDGVITLAELLDGNLLNSARLVVVSACQSAVVNIVGAGDEFVGLPAGFLQSGASAVVGSLWPASDLATSLLMTYFYDELLSTDDPAAALRTAQRRLRDSTAAELGATANRSGGSLWLLLHAPEDRPFAHPYYWAAFVLVGR